MSADWFCKIEGRKIGPLNGQQLKTAVAKGQIRADHLVRRGEEGPWVPAGKIKGLFPEASAAPAARPAPKAMPLPSARPAAGAPPVPTAQAAPTPPASDMPEEFRMGGSHGHSEFSVDQFEISEPAPKTKRRKSKGGSAIPKGQQKQVTMILMCIIGIGIPIGLGALGYALYSQQSANHEAQDKADAAAKVADAAAAKRDEEIKKLEVQQKEDSKWAKVPSKWTEHGKVQLQVAKPTRQAPPADAKLDAEKYPDVLVLSVELKLKDGVKEPVPLAGWESMKSDIYLKDDDGKKYPLLSLVSSPPDAKAVAADPLKVQFVFTDPEINVKYLHLELPATAFGESGMVDYEIGKDQLPPRSGKKSSSDKKSDDAVAGGKPGDAKGGDDKPSAEAKTGKKDEGDIGLPDPDKK